MKICTFSFQKRFSTESRCWRYLFKQHWSDGFVCPKCGHRRATFLAERKVFQCRNCRYQASVTAGTIFHKIRTPLRKWFWIIFLISQNKTGYSVLGLQKFLQINLYKTAWLMAHKIRQAMAQRDAPYKLAGLVEMDDSYFGAKGVAGKRGGGAQKKSKVIVSVQLNDNKRPLFANMQVVDQLDKRSISQSLYNKIGCGTRVDTDGWACYNILKEQGLDHRRKHCWQPKECLKASALGTHCHFQLQGNFARNLSWC